MPAVLRSEAWKILSQIRRKETGPGRDQSPAGLSKERQSQGQPSDRVFLVPPSFCVPNSCAPRERHRACWGDPPSASACAKCVCQVCVSVPSLPAGLRHPLLSVMLMSRCLFAVTVSVISILLLAFLYDYGRRILLKMYSATVWGQTDLKRNERHVIRNTCLLCLLRIP